MKPRRYPLLALILLLVTACGDTTTDGTDTPDGETPTATAPRLTDKYAQVTLTADLSGLSEKEKQMIPLLIDAAQIMHKLFLAEAFGTRDELEALSKGDKDKRKFAAINYGPWDRLDGNTPFIDGVGDKPLGARFYPEDMTKEEFEGADFEDKEGLYSMVRRKEDGTLYTIPYHEYFADDIEKASAKLKEAAALAEDPGLKKYLELRAEAFLTDDYRPSDMAWMDMTENGIDVVIGPIETYEDQLFGYRAAHECYVLVKDKAWSARLAKYATFLPELQEGLPVPDKYKEKLSGTGSQLNAYDVVYYAGDCNAGSKTIAINLPNDETVQKEKGTRRLQLKNAMRAKFDQILLPISGELIREDQRKHITFDAFFANTMFHEVAHGLGVKNVVGQPGMTVRKALKEHSSALEEGKADILGLYMITQLHAKGEVEGDLEDYYVTFLASIFRSIRFGASSAHGKANMIRFNFFQEHGAFTRDENGVYAVDFEKMKGAMNALSRNILTLQGDGDYEGVAALVAEKGVIQPELQGDLDRLSDKGIPVDIVFDQGLDKLGL